MSPADDLYDHVPYPSQPLFDAHPDRVLTLAHLLGRDVPDPATARVLDLGCGTGVHLLALAATHPELRLTGVDRSANQIATARATAQALGLGDRITFVHGDLSRVDLDTYELITAWGVYSWTDDPTRDALLRRARAHLAPGGLVVVGYNTLPGWHMLGMVREMMRFHTEGLTDPRARIAAARELIDFLRAVVHDRQDAYAAWLDDVAGLLAASPDAYVLHEFLEPEHHPVTVADFLAHAATHDLHGVTEARWSTTRIDNFPDEVRAVLQGEAERTDDPLHVEQLMDYLRNKRFRATVLSPHPGPGRPEVFGARMAGRFVRARHGEPTVDDEGVVQLSTPTGYTAALATPLARRVAHHLAAARPGWVAVDDLVQAMADDVPEGRSPDEAVHDVLVASLALDGLDVRTAPPDLAPAPGARPRGLPLARHLARVRPGLDVPSAHHEPVHLDDDARALLLDLDGTHDRAALAARWAARRDATVAPDVVDEALHTLHRRGLLQPSEG